MNRTDASICGSGLAGRCAALTAAECGAEVSSSRNGFSRREFGAGGRRPAFAGSDYRRRAESETEWTGPRRDPTEAGGGKGDPALIETDTANELETSDSRVTS